LEVLGVRVEIMLIVLASAGVIAISSKVRLCFLIVPVMSGICISGDTWRSRGRPSNDNINGKEGEGVGSGVMEVAGDEEKANISRQGAWARLLGMRLRGSMETLWREATKLAQGAISEQMV
jgi:hypothetical protein